MLTGQMAFQGEDVSLTLSSVLQREPDWSRLPSEVSPSLSVFLHRCLEKDPKRRVHDVADVRLAMEGAFELAPDPESTVSRVGSLRWRALLITTIAASVITGFLVWSLMAQRPGGVPLGPQTTFTVVPPGGAQAESPWLSPDGRAIAFQARPLAFVGLADASGGQIYVRRLEELDAVPLQNTDGTELYSFSPDGQWLLVDRQAELARVPLAGGATIRIGESSGAAHWGFNDRIVQGSTEGLRHISASSGETTQLTTASEGEAHFAPRPFRTAAAFCLQCSSPELTMPHKERCTTSSQRTPDTDVRPVTTVRGEWTSGVLARRVAVGGAVRRGAFVDPGFTHNGGGKCSDGRKRVRLLLLER